MTVSFASAGYGGSITQEAWADLASQLGHEYSVKEPGDWTVAPATGDRAITISPGTGQGHGVRDTTTDAEPLFIPAVTSGSLRYDLIVARRNWATKLTAFAIVEGSTARDLPARANTPGLLDEQPIALVRVNSGSAVIHEIIDLRVWAGNGGMYAKHSFVRKYLETIGTEVNINGAAWALQIGAMDLPTWVEKDGVTVVPITPAAGWSNVTEPMTVEKSGRTCVLNGFVYRASGTGIVVGTLPTGFRPTSSQWDSIVAWGVNGTDGPRFRLKILTTGEIQVNYLPGSPSWGNTSWLPINVTFFAAAAPAD